MAFAIIGPTAVLTAAAITYRNEIIALSNAKQIAMACRLYAIDKKGAFPASLDLLTPDYITNSKVFICPFSGPTVLVGYLYFGGKVTDPPDNLLLVSKGESKGHRRVVVHVDGTGSVQELTPDQERMLMEGK